MKRFRVKVGLGLALAAGTATVDWRALGAAPVDVVPAGAPGLLPTTMRVAPNAKTDPGPIWLPARQPAPVIVPVGAIEPAPIVPYVTPAPVPQPQPSAAGYAQQDPSSFGPRVGGGIGPLPEIGRAHV